MCVFLSLEIASAANTRVNEIVSNPEVGGEWIELFFTADADISHFTLSDEKGVIFTFPADSIFSADDFFIAEGWNNKLNNSGDSVFLRDENNVEITSVLSFPKMEKGESWAWNGADFEKIETITKGEENIFPESEGSEITEDENILGKGFSPPQVGEIEMTEIMSNSTTGDEWIEIFSTATEIRNLSSFTFSDEVGVIYTFPANFGISPNEYLAISGWKTKLNNSGDSALLKDFLGNTFDSVNSFPSLDKNITWAKKEDDSFEKTGSPTPAAENIFVTASTSSGSSGAKKQLVKTKASMPSVSANDVQILISEVMFRGKEEDFVELYCKKCDKDLGGFRLVDDDVFFEFPPKTFVKSGEYIVVHLSKNDEGRRDVDLSRPKNIWHFSATKTGLTGTDETIFLIDSRGGIEHALCIANQNGEFSPGERDDVIALINQRAIRAYHPLSENACFDSRLLGTNISLVFSGQRTGHSDKDFFWSPTPTPGEKNPAPPKRAEKIKLEMNVWESEKISFVEIKNLTKKIIDTKNIRLFDDEKNEISVPKEILIPNEKMFFSLKNVGNGRDHSSITITDFWNAEITRAQTKKIEFTQEKTDIIFSEFFANPTGSDTGKEFVEITCLAEKCDTSHFFFFVNEKEISFGKKQLKKNEKEALFLSVKNTEFTAEIYDLSQKKYFSIQVPNAKEGQSFSYFSHEEFLWGKSTPQEKNIPFVLEKSEDSDNDGIPDISEITIDSDPFSPEEKYSPEHKIFKNVLRHGLDFSIIETNKEIEISGKSLPNTKIMAIVNSRKSIIKTETDENGYFSFVGNPNILAGNHSVDLLVFPTPHHPILYKNFTNISLSENPKEKILSSISITLALPNPTGSDAKNEMIILENTGEKNGWAKNISLVVGEKKMLLPEFFLKAGQKKVLKKNDIPTLLNSNSSITLADANGKILDSVSWKKARSGEWFGKHAPIFIPKKTTKKRISKRKIRNPIPMPTEKNPPEKITGELAFAVRNHIGIRQGEKVTAYTLNDNFSRKTISNLVPKGTPVEIIVEESRVTAFGVSPFAHTEDLRPFKNIQPFLFLFLILSIFFNAGIVAYRKKILCR